MGLRELKKEQTRRHIAATALRLFRERGFDKVTVAQVARTAQVSEATVFNYFPTKEDLFYSGLEAFGERLVAAVADRSGSVLAAVRDFMSDTSGMLEQIEAGDADVLDRARTMHQIITASPALLAREQLGLARIAKDLARELGDDFNAEVTAHALLGVHRSALDLARRRVLSDDPGPIAADVRAHVRAACDILERGLGDQGRC